MAIHDPVERHIGGSRCWTIAVDDDDWAEVSEVIDRLGYDYRLYNRIRDGERRGVIIKCNDLRLVTYLRMRF